MSISLRVLRAVFGGLWNVSRKAVYIIAVAAMFLMIVFGGNTLLRYSFSLVPGAWADFLATVPGTGTNFASVPITVSSVLAQYQTMLLCDAAAGKGTCGAVVAGSGAATTSNNALVTTLSPSSAGFIPGQSNATSAVATGSANLPSIAYLYGFNGVTWDQLQVDGAKNLKVTSAGSQSNASSAVATSSTNATSVAWLYGFNGTTWDQLQVDASKNLKVAIVANATATADPCASGTHQYIPISQVANTQLAAAGAAGTVNYICAYQWNGADAESISLVEGTGSVCATATGAIIGAPTATAGNNFAANSGAAGGTGRSTLTAGTGTAKAVCLFQSGSGRVAGFINIVQQ